MIPKEVNWNHPLSQATLTALCIPLLCAGYGAAKHPGGAEYFQNQGNYLEIRLGQRLFPAMSPGKSSLRKGFGLKFGFILSYPLVLGCLSIQTRVSLELIVLKTFPLWFSSWEGNGASVGFGGLGLLIFLKTRVGIFNVK